MKHVVMFSTGLSSAVCLSKVQEKHGRDNTMALLTDTQWEDEDNYRFSNEVIGYLNANLVVIKEGRTPKDVWLETRYLVGPTGAPCTRILKIEQTMKWLKQQEDEITLYFGIGADEEHRTHGLVKRYTAVGAKVEFPLVDEPMEHLQMKDIVENEWGIKIPRMYYMGFSHANCGGRCVKAGQEHFIRLMKQWPERFNEIADIEQRFRDITNSDTTILRAKRNGEEVKITLRELQKEQDTGQLSLCWDSEIPCECFF